MSISRTDSRVASDAAATYRADFVRVVAGVGLDLDQATSLAEAMSGRRFHACGPHELALALAQLAALAEQVRVAQFSGSPACHE